MTGISNLPPHGLNRVNWSAKFWAGGGGVWPRVPPSSYTSALQSAKRCFSYDLFILISLPAYFFPTLKKPKHFYKSQIFGGFRCHEWIYSTLNSRCKELNFSPIKILSLNLTSQFKETATIQVQIVSFCFSRLGDLQKSFVFNSTFSLCTANVLSAEFTGECLRTKSQDN